MYQPPDLNECNHHPISQQRLNMLVRQLKLSQRKAEILTTHLKAANILEEGVLVTGFRSRQKSLLPFFDRSTNNTLAFCKNIPGLVTEMVHIEYNPDHWRLFIDSSKSSLKAVLLYFDNSKAGVPVAMSTNTKESYDQLKSILEKLHYNEHQWRICADLKVVNTLCGLQAGYTKYMCFLCLWDTRYSGNQYSRRDWAPRNTFVVNRANVANEPLVVVDKVLLPPLHIKLGIVKNFVKALHHNSAATEHLKVIFPKLSAMKIKEGERVLP